MSEVALYRKYRSNDFDAVVGQTEVIQTLKHAVASGRISHAYLFTGPRGVGKTSVARLLARAINCTGSPQPCNSCFFCKTDLNGNLDLIEIDAASNRRIDEIRDLRDKINLAPAQAKYKVYIIDEVHMLTNEAFNALLKTLEEPPAHAIFILATTEFHKLPATIVSRTQRFNFRPIGLADTKARLQKIAKAEKIAITDEALTLLAAAGDGSLRDAISLLDQLANFDQAELDAAAVRALLGWGDPKNIIDLSQAIAGGQPGEVLKLTQQIEDSGVQASQIIQQLIDFWRQLLTAVASKAAQDLPLKNLDLDFIILVLDGLVTAKASPLPELALEATTIKLALIPGETLQASLPIITTAAPESAPQPQPISRPTVPQADSSIEVPQLTTNADLSQEQAWQKALFLIKEYNNSLYALIKSCEATFSGDSLILGCRFSFHRQRLEEVKNRTVIERALKAAFGRPMQLVIAQNEVTSTPANSTGELVTTAIEILGGEVVE